MNTFNHEKTARCPACAKQFEISDQEEGDLYKEGSHSLTCPYCDHDFEVVTRVTWSFESPEIRLNVQDEMKRIVALWETDKHQFQGAEGLRKLMLETSNRFELFHMANSYEDLIRAVAGDIWLQSSCRLRPVGYGYIQACYAEKHFGMSPDVLWPSVASCMKGLYGPARDFTPRGVEMGF